MSDTPSPLLILDHHPAKTDLEKQFSEEGAKAMVEAAIANAQALVDVAEAACAAAMNSGVDSESQEAAKAQRDAARTLLNRAQSLRGQKGLGVAAALAWISTSCTLITASIKGEVAEARADETAAVAANHPDTVPVRMTPVLPLTTAKHPHVTVDVVNMVISPFHDTTRPPADPVKVEHAKEELSKVTKQGTYVDVQKAAHELAIAQNGGVDDDKTWNDARTNQQIASAKRVLDGKGAYGGGIDGITLSSGEIVGRNAAAWRNKQLIEGYLEAFNADEKNKPLIKALDHDGDGKVTIEEFERAKNNNTDISYAKMAALDAPEAGLVPDWVQNRTVSQHEFMKTVKYIASVAGITQEDVDALTQNKGLFDENKDGRTTLDEIRRYFEKHTDLTWQGVDANHDGVVSKQELTAAMQEALEKAREAKKAEPMLMMRPGVETAEKAAAKSGADPHTQAATAVGHLPGVQLDSLMQPASANAVAEDGTPTLLMRPSATPNGKPANSHTGHSAGSHSIK